MKRSDIPTVAVLVACGMRPKGVMPYELLRDAFDAPLKVVYAAMRREERKGNIDYGVSLRCAFLTDRGRVLLAMYRPEYKPCA